MKKQLRVMLLSILILGLMLNSGVVLAMPGTETESQTTEFGEFAPGRLLVRFKDGVTANAAANVLADFGLVYLENLYASPIQLVQVPAGEELALVEKLNADPRVEYAEVDGIFHADVIPNDTFYGSQWGLPKINAPGAWDISTGSSSVTIAIVDSGVDLDHPDLAAKLLAGYDFVDSDTVPQDLNGHGTHTAGISAASSNNGVGVAGVSWGAMILPVRVLNASGSGTLSGVVNGINYATANGADIINLSLGGTTNYASLETAVNDAYAAGILVVASAGNCGDSDYPYNGCTSMNQTSYPGAYANAFAVASTTSSDTRSSFSTQGSYVDIAAPGSDIYSTYYNNTYYNDSGTSMSAPFVCGLAALILSLRPGYTPAQVRQVMESTAVDLGAPGVDIAFGAGRINALAALQSVSLYAPTLAAINNPENDGSYTVDWGLVPVAASYELQEDDNAGFSSPVTRYSGANNQLIVTSQALGTWYYRVRASDGLTWSAWSNVVSTQVVLSAPLLAAISNPTSADNYLVSWNSVTGAGGYRLEESPNNTFSPVNVRYIGTALQYPISGQGGGTWYYRVIAYKDVFGSTASNVVSTSVTAPTLGVPTLNMIDNEDGDAAFTVTWQSVTGAAGYRLEESASAFFEQVTVVYDGTLLEFDFTNHASGIWYYRVRATAPTGNSPWSAFRIVLTGKALFIPAICK